MRSRKTISLIGILLSILFIGCTDEDSNDANDIDSQSDTGPSNTDTDTFDTGTTDTGTGTTDTGTGSDTADTATATRDTGTTATDTGTATADTGTGSSDTGTATTDTGTTGTDSETAAEVAYTLQLLHFSDIDGDEASMQRVDEFATMLAQFKTNSDYSANTLVLSAGDNYIPGPSYYAAAEVDSLGEYGRGHIALLNEMGVVASAVGNHEIDLGVEAFTLAISPELNDDGLVEENNFPGAQFPYLSANLDFSTDSASASLVAEGGQDVAAILGKFAPSATVNVGGETIGLVGATTPGLASITSTGNITITPAGEWTTETLAAEIQQEVDALTAMGINKIILMCHMQQIAYEEALAPLLRDVDIIIAGGSNTLLADDNDALLEGDVKVDNYPLSFTSVSGDPVLVVNTDGDYKYLGRLVAGFDTDGVLLLDTLDDTVNGAFKAEDAGNDPDTTTAIGTIQANLKAIVDAQYANVMGYTSVWLEGRRVYVRSEETNLGNLSADANLWYAEVLSGETVDLSIKNGGGIRSEIGYMSVPYGTTDAPTYLPPQADATLGISEGAVSQGNIATALRFNNGLCLMTVTAQELKDIFESTIMFSAVDSLSGNYPQVSSTVRVSYDLDNAARDINDDNDTVINPGERIVNLSVGGTAVVTDGVVDITTGPFRLVTLNYLVNTDSYAFPDDEGTGDRLNLYEGLGYGDPEDETHDAVDVTNDPGLASFTTTGYEQDALAEYFMANHASYDVAYAVSETSAAEDARIQNLDVVVADTVHD